MARTEYPKWFWDLIIRIEKHEDEHAAAPGSTCLRPVLAIIPTEVREQAAAISSYAHAAAATDGVMQRAAADWHGFGFSTDLPVSDQPGPFADCTRCEHDRDHHREGRGDCEYEPTRNGTRCDCDAFGEEAGP